MNNKTFCYYLYRVGKHLSLQTKNLVADKFGYQFYVFDSDHYSLLVVANKGHLEMGIDHKFPGVVSFGNLREILKRKTRSEFEKGIHHISYTYPICHILTNPHLKIIGMETLVALDKCFAMTPHRTIYIGEPQALIIAAKTFTKLGVPSPFTFENRFNDLLSQNCQNYNEEQQLAYTNALSFVKNQCINLGFVSESTKQNQYSLYYEGKSLIFISGNIKFTAVEFAPDSWQVMHQPINCSQHVTPTLETITLTIKKGQFVQAGSNLHPFHYALYRAEYSLEQEIFQREE